MATSPVSYPVTEAAYTALQKFPNIGKLFPLPAIGLRSEYEMVRLLENTHYPHIVTLLTFIDKWVPISGCIWTRLLRCKDPFSLEQSIAELSMLAHLSQRFTASDISVCESSDTPVCPDLIVRFGDLCIKIEIYTPVELIGYRMLDRYLELVTKYLEVPRGYYLDIEVRPKRIDDRYNPSDCWYPYTIPPWTDVRAWLEDYKKRLMEWLGSEPSSSDIRIVGPGGKIEIFIKLLHLYDDPRCRRITSSWATRSTDTSLFFEVGTVENTVKSEWGKKITAKLRRMQCGSSSPGNIRILAINFTIADTGWPEFISQEPFSSRFKEMILYIAGKDKPYDAVIPSRLDCECCFGKAVWIDPSKEEQGMRFIEGAALNIPCQPRAGVQIP